MADYEQKVRGRPLPNAYEIKVVYLLRLVTMSLR